MQKQIIGDYLVGENIGKGSFGKVKKGVHLPTGENVAIKVLNRQKLKTANMDKKIRREIKILKLFHHPNICRLYEVIQTPTDIFLFMEFVEGGELYETIVKQGKLKEDVARYIFQQMVCALEYGHHFRVIHRDLKPENILLGAQLQVKMIDFGLSNLMHDGDFLATSCGSPNYAAPEVISGKLYAGPEIDVWSLGVVLFALLCGFLPFDEDTIPLLFGKIKKGKYSIPSWLSNDAKDLIEKLLVVDPLARLTIPQIRDHRWFVRKLPPHLMYHESVFSEEERIRNSFAREAARLLKCDESTVRESILCGEGRGFVAYSILKDADRRKRIASIHEQVVEDPSAVQMTASQRELNLGLVLVGSPIMEAAVEGDAASNKKAYNTNTFVPASVQESRTMLAPPSNHSIQSGGAFSLPKSSGLTSSGPQTIGSPSPASMKLATPQQQDKQRIGSVVKRELLYTAEEEKFMLDNNTGWRVGMMTDQRSGVSMAAIYDVLKSFELEWKVVAQFRLVVRPLPVVKYRSKQYNNLVFRVNLFRLNERHDKGFIVDFGIASGNILIGLSIVKSIAASLTEKVG